MLERTLGWTPVGLAIRPVSEPEAAAGEPGMVDVLDAANVDAIRMMRRTLPIER